MGSSKTTFTVVAWRDRDAMTTRVGPTADEGVLLGEVRRRAEAKYGNAMVVPQDALPLSVKRAKAMLAEREESAREAEEIAKYLDERDGVPVAYFRAM